jgi:phosphopantothenoylcysteine synthetase/decarboxylase
MRVIVTAGGTEEAIDGVRRLTNVSTGSTGGVIARTFAEHGAEVLLLHAERVVPVPADLERETFVTHADLEAGLRRHLRDGAWEAVIHLAAVSDYSVAAIEVDGIPVAHGNHGKIASGHDVVIRLKPTTKLVDGLKSWSRNPSIQVVGFKLTNTADPAVRAAEVRALLARGSTDLVVHNDLAEITENRHPAEIWTAGGPIVRTSTKDELALALFDLLRKDGRSDGGYPEEKTR